MTPSISEETLKRTIGLRLRQARQTNKLTMKQVGEKIGASKGYVANIEAGITGLSFARMVALAEMYGVDPAWLAGFRDSNEGPYITASSDFNTDDIVLKSSYLEKKGLKGDRLLCVEVQGKSMEPMIYDGSLAIANMEVQGILDRDLYALKVHDKYCVRWMEATEDGNYRIESETNDPFFLPNCTITPEELTQLEVIGRIELVLG